MHMTEKIEIFATKECPKCVKLAIYLDSKGVGYVKRVIDEDPEAETDALMFNIFSAPALKKGDKLLRVKDMFDGDDNVNEGAVCGFLGI